MSSFYDTLLCPSIVPHMIGLGQAWILYKTYDNLLSLLRLSEIYGFSALGIYIDNEEYLLITLYHVSNSSYELYDVVEDHDWLKISGKVVVLKPSVLGKYLKKLGVKPFIKKKNDLLKQNIWCSGRRERVCLLSTGNTLTYGSTYLTLSMACREESLEIKAMEFFDKIVEVIRNPLVNLVKQLGRKEKIGDDLVEKIIDEIDKYLLIYISNLIMKHQLILPDIKTTSDLVNYVKTHFKW